MLWEKEHNDDHYRSMSIVLERLEYVESKAKRDLEEAVNKFENGERFLREEMQKLKENCREEVREYECIQEIQSEIQEEWKHEGHEASSELKASKRVEENYSKATHAQIRDGFQATCNRRVAYGRGTCPNRSP